MVITVDISVLTALLVSPPYRGKKKINTPITNVKVFTIGTIIEEEIIPKDKLIFFNNLNRYPDTKPLRAVFTMQRMIVAKALCPRNNPVVGANKTMTPTTPPTRAPFKGP